MSQDKGGIDYAINVTGSGFQTLIAFRNAALQARASLRGLKEEAAAFGVSSVSVAKGSETLAQAARKAAQAANDEATATQRVTRTLNTRAEAIRKVNAEGRRNAIDREAAVVTSEREFNNERKRLTLLQAQRAAASDLTRIENQRLIVKARAEEATQQSRIETIKLRAQDKAALAQILAAQGLKPDGTPIPAPPQAVTLQDKIQKAVNKAQGKEAFRQAMALRGLKPDGTLLPLAPVPKTLTEQADQVEKIAQNKEAFRQIMAARGLLPNGQPLPQPKPILTTAQQADKVQTTAASKAALQAELASRGLGPNGQPLPKAPAPPSLVDRIKEFLGLKRATDDAEDSANRFGSTTRRLLVSLFAFSGIRAAISGFRGFVESTIAFNKELETAKIGIAAVLAATGKVTTATGQSVSEAQRFALAQKEAARQVNLLRVDSLRTTASFEDLVTAFQTAIAPGLGAGLGIDQIRKFAVDISQAATAIGLSQAQLAEEIRSLLQGTITPRNTRIATALGITNDDIKRAKELGTLADLLNKKFAAFGLAGDALSQTFEGLLNRARTAVQVVTSQASLPLFNELKDLLKVVFGLLVEIDNKTKEIRPNPAAVAAFRTIFEHLKNIVAAARQAIGALKLADFQRFADLFGTILEFVGKGIIGGIQGLIEGFSTVVQILGKLKQAANIVFPFLDAVPFQTVAVILGRIIAYLLTAAVIIRAAPLIIGAITIAWNAAKTAVAIYTAVVEASTVATKAASVAASGLSKSLKSAGIGILIALLAGAADFGLRKAGVWDKLFGTEAEQAGSVNRAKNIAQLIRNTFDDAQVQISASADALKGFEDVLRTLADEFEKIRREFRFKLFDLIGADQIKGADGGALKVFETSLHASVELAEKQKQIVREKQALQVRGIQLTNQETALNKKIADLGTEFKVSGVEVLDAKEKLIDIYNKLQKAQEELTQLQNTGTSDTLEQLKAFQKFQGLPISADPQKEINRLQASIIKMEQARLDIVKELGGDAEAQTKFIGLAGEALTLRGQQATVQAQITELAKANNSLEAEHNRILNQKLSIIARQAAAEQELANIPLRAQGRAAGRALAVRRAPQALQDVASSEDALDSAKATAQVEAVRLAANQKILAVKIRELNVTIENLRAQEAVLTAEIEAAQTTNTDEGDREAKTKAAERLAISTQILSAAEALNEVQKLQTQSIEEQNIKLQEQKDIEARLTADRDEAIRKAATGADKIFDQLHLSIQDLDRSLPSQFQIIFDTLKNVVDGFSKVVSDTIVDAFDPTKKIDLKQRFGLFLQDIARQVIQTLVQIAVTKAILFAIGASVGGNVGAISGGAGRHRGGRISPSHHRHAAGFAFGGPIRRATTARPRHLHPSDTVPIWADPREWVIQAKSVAKAGERVMSRINEGLFDPGKLREAVNVPGSTPTAAAGPGLALGGSVGASIDTRRAVATVSKATAASPQQSSGPVPAFIVASDHAAEQFLNGGALGVHRWLQDNGYRRT